MNILIEPNYELFVQILFIITIGKMILNFVCGFAQVEIPRFDKAGGPEISTGIYYLVIIICVLI